MPFTPFHLGPACPLKAVLGRHFSLTVFAFAQVAMDLEPLVRLLRRDGLLHGPSHTYLGAALVGVLSLLVGRPVCQWLVRSWPTSPETPFLNWLRGPATISWPAAAVGAFVGTFSHVFLDSLMHFDMRPLAPFAGGNGLQGLIPATTLHLLCAGVGLVGLVILYVDYRLSA